VRTLVRALTCRAQRGRSSSRRRSTRRRSRRIARLPTPMAAAVSDRAAAFRRGMRRSAMLILMAYGLSGLSTLRRSLPGWRPPGMTSRPNPASAVDAKTARLMLQNLLAERFSLKVHHEAPRSTASIWWSTRAAANSRFRTQLGSGSGLWVRTGFRAPATWGCSSRRSEAHCARPSKTTPDRRQLRYRSEMDSRRGGGIGQRAVGIDLRRDPPAIGIESWRPLR
jgi:hypothetical protein